MQAPAAGKVDMKRRQYLAASLAVSARFAAPAGLFALAGCEAPGAPPARLAGTTMGTTYHVSLAQPLSPREALSLRAGIEAVLARVDALMSTYRPDSELVRFNAAPAGARLVVSPDTAVVVDHALRTWLISGGAFDATVGPLVDLWGFGPHDVQQLPTDEAVADASALVGSDDLAVDPATGTLVKARDGVQLDLSGIAKGHAVDRVAEHLDGAGIDAYLVDIGGELRSRGRKADRSTWRVGIEKPLPGERRLQRVLALDGESIATSGDYRNFFERGGRHYSHTIDPRSGRPVQHALAGVSVIAERAMQADALATALMVLGPDAGMALAERLALPALFLSRGAGGGVIERATRDWAGRIVA